MSVLKYSLHFGHWCCENTTSSSCGQPLNKSPKSCRRRRRTLRRTWPFEGPWTGLATLRALVVPVIAVALNYMGVWDILQPAECAFQHIFARPQSFCRIYLLRVCVLPFCHSASLCALRQVCYSLLILRKIMVIGIERLD